MRRSLLSLVLATASLSGVLPVTLNAATAQQRHHRYYSSRSAHRKTMKRVGIGAAGGAAIGALAGGGKGAGIGAAAGAGAGYLYDRHKKHEGPR
jgi:outer membrane lipoprotein SlyB